MDKQKKCFLKSIDNLHQPLPINEEETFFGRSPDTLIQDTFCSRKQISLRVDFMENCVYMKQLGLNSSALNGFVLEPNHVYKAYHSDCIEILHNRHFHEIVFEPKPISTADINKQQKLLKNNKKNVEEPASMNIETPEANRKRYSSPIDDIDVDVPLKKRKDLVAPVGWEHIDNGLLLIYTSAGVIAKTKIAAYDIDGTIIKTKSGNVFAKSCDDWQINLPEIPGKLKSLHKDDYKIVFFTNQAGISKGTTKISDLKKKIERIVSKLNVPIQVFISTGKSRYRKPLIGMWESLRDNKNDGIQINLNESFFVGDAAGRPEKKQIKKKKDHSLADRYMAMNVGMKFQTPEEHFQNVKTQEWIKPEFDPKAPFPINLLEPKRANLTSNKLEVIIMVGYPGSGKSHFARNHLSKNGYNVINRDTLKSWQKCVQALEQSLTKNISAVIDNTNGDKESRKRYIDVARQYNAPCRCFIMNTNYRHTKHNIVFREITNPSHPTINDIVINKYKSTFKEPNEQEGFTEIVRVNFIPTFVQNDHETLYQMYLLD